ncbi:MAG: N-terminal phage integrase SAM-like domain-containing protein, partial [archaeon]
MAYYRETKSGKWEVEVYLGINPSTGKPKYESQRFKRKRDAKKWARDKEINRDMGIIVNAGNYTVETYLKEWIEDHKDNISPTTYDGYNMIINVHLIPALGKLKLDELKPIHIKSYFNHKKKKGRSDGKKGGLSQKTLLQHY